ncbi:MAG: DUF502 domain-containing protein [Nevskiaceae bacterium]
MPRLARTFLSGLAVVLPIVITIAVLLWLVTTTETLLSPVAKWVLPEGTYPRGLGFLVAVGLIFAVGVLMEAVYFRRLMEWLEGLLNRIPLVKTVYSAVRDLMSLFSKAGSKKFSKVVMVTFPGTDAKLIGFVTIEDFADLPVAPGAGRVAVYLPMSYTIGGYTVFLPRDCLTPLDMSLEEAMRFVVTAGMSRS